MGESVILKSSYINTTKLSAKELETRLKKLSEFLETHDQDRSAETNLDEIAAALVQPTILKHQKDDIRLLAACCLADVIRIYAPDAPYDSNTLEAVFKLFISQLANLENLKSPSFKQLTGLLERLAIVKAFVLMADVEPIIVKLFDRFFGLISVEHSNVVTVHMLDILISSIEEAEVVFESVLEIIFTNLISNENEAARRLAQHLVHKCDEKLIPVITNYLGAIISNGKTTETDLHTKVHEIVFELNSVAPKVLINVLPNMEPELKFDDLDTRAQAVQLFARMFAAKESTMPHTYYQLFNTFLTRFKDIHEDIRCVMIEFAQHFILTQKDQKLVQDVANELEERLRDRDEKVRQAAVSAVVFIGTKNINVLPPRLLDEVIIRMRDKKLSIRAEAMTGLAKLYNLAHAAWDEVEEEAGGEGKKKGKKAAATPRAQASKWTKDRKKCFDSIPSHILKCHAVIGEADDKFRIEKILNEELIPATLSSEERANKLAIMVSSLDANAHDAFVRMLKEKKAFREEFKQFLILSASGADKEAILRKKLSLRGRLPVMNGGDKFEKMLKLGDEHLMKSFSTLVNPKSTDKAIASAKDSIEKKYGKSGKKTNLGEYIMTIVHKLSAILIDKDGVSHVIDHLVATLDDDADDVASVTPLITLLGDLSECYPSYFAGSALSSLAALMEQHKRADVLDKVLYILSNIGSFARDDTETSKALKKPLANVCLKGTPKQAKLAIISIHQIYPDEKSILDKLSKELLGRLSAKDIDAKLSTALSALKQIAKVMPSVLTSSVNRIVSFVVDDLLPLAMPAKKSGDKPSYLCAAKLEGFKAVANLLIGHQENKSVTPKQVKLFIDEAFETLESGDHPSVKSESNESDRAYIRAGVVTAILKLARHRRLESEISLPQFQLLANISNDSSANVRRQAILKVFTGLRSISHLGLKYLALLVLFGLDKDKENQSNAKKFLQYAISIRRRFWKENEDKLSKDGKEPDEKYVGKVMSGYLPEYALPWLVHLIAHQEWFTDDAKKKYETTSKYMSLFIEYISNATDNFAFLRTMLSDIKQTEDAQNPSLKHIQVVSELGLLLCERRLKSKMASVGMPLSKPSSYMGIVFLPEQLYQIPKSKSGNSPELLSASQKYLPANFHLPQATGEFQRILNAPAEQIKETKKRSRAARSEASDEGDEESVSVSISTSTAAKRRTVPKRAASTPVKKAKTGDEDGDEESGASSSEDESEEFQEKKTTPTKRSPAKRKRAADASDNESDEDSGEQKRSKKKSLAKPSPSKATKLAESEENEPSSESDIGDDDDIEKILSTPSKKTSRGKATGAAAKKAGKAGKKAGKAAASISKGKKKEFEEEQGGSESPKTVGKKAAAVKTKAKKAAAVEDDSAEENGNSDSENEVAAKRARPTRGGRQ